VLAEVAAVRAVPFIVLLDEDVPSQARQRVSASEPPKGGSSPFEFGSKRAFNAFVVRG